MIEQLSSEEKKGILETLEKEDQMYRQISDHWAGIFDPSVRPLIDEEDGVLRCPNCGWEGNPLFFQIKGLLRIKLK